MRHLPVATTLAAVVFLSSRAHAEDAPPKLVLPDVVGIATNGTTGWVSYQRFTDERDLPPFTASKSAYSSLSIQPRFEVVVARYLTLGAELGYQRTAQRYDYENQEPQQSVSHRFTVVPIVGGRVPLPRGFSLWGHVGFGGGANLYASGEGASAQEHAQLVSRFRSDVRVGFEPVRGLVLTLGPELQRNAASRATGLGSGSALSFGLFGGVSFVIR